MKLLCTATVAAFLTSSVSANTYAGNEVDAWSTLFTAIDQDIRVSDGKPEWEKCRGTQTDPCKCAKNHPGFVCSGEEGDERTILEISFTDNNFETVDKLFPAAEVEAFLQAVDTVEVFKIMGDTDGLGDDSQGCVTVPSCESITCDFSPRVLCDTSVETDPPSGNSTGNSTSAPTTSPTNIEIGPGELTNPPTATPTVSPTPAPTVDQVTAWESFFNSIAHVRLENNNPDWLACRGVIDKPCNCANKEVDGEPVDVTVTCTDVDENDATSGTIVAIEFGDNNFQSSNKTFPAEEVNQLLGIGTITTFRLSGNVAGLGDETQGCVSVPRCYNDGITCDFSPRVLCSQPTVAPTSSPEFADDITDTPTASPEVGVPTDDITSSPTASPIPQPTTTPTNAPTRIPQEEAWPIFFDAMSFVKREDLKPDWVKCRGTRENPCNCENNNPGFDCNDNGEIVSVFFSNNSFSNNGTFPVEAVNTFLGMDSIVNITILGDTEGLGGAEQGCLQILNCHIRDIECNFAPRELCAAPTAAPTSSPNTPQPASSPTASPESTSAPTASDTTSRDIITETPTTGSASRSVVEISIAFIMVIAVSML